MNGEELYQQVRKDGFFVVPGFFAPSDVMAVRKDLAAILDGFEKLPHDENNAAYKSGHKSTYLPMMHSVWHVSMLSPGLAGMMSEILSHDAIKYMMRKVVGPDYRMRIDLARRSSGLMDGDPKSFQIPHQWHVDTPGEFTFGIYFDDMRAPNSGNTGAIKSTHWLDYRPQWDMMLGPDSLIRAGRRWAKERIMSAPLAYKADYFTEKLRRKLAPDCTEINGGIGDFYFFLNRVWHGRMPNTTGKRLMTVRFGGFACDYPFKDDIPLPENAMERLPPVLQQAYAANKPAVTDPAALMHEMDREKRKHWLFDMAKHEKSMAVHLSNAIATGQKPFKRTKDAA
ncbi:MAG: hypothetical protein OXT65_11540 [Alphaproteobacteria bacterium]|nr:hypothetical protein [Alphaproteobacteria bacterium]